eukprot:scaffold143644_cov142-Phaeocystis_antarctica.AAC.1
MATRRMNRCVPNTPMLTLPPVWRTMRASMKASGPMPGGAATEVACSSSRQGAPVRLYAARSRE